MELYVLPSMSIKFVIPRGKKQNKSYTRKMSKFPIKIAAVLILLSYIWISVFGLLQTSHMSHMASGSHDCPYMVGQHSICPMDAFHHLQAWQAFSTVIVPLFEVLLLAACLFVTVQLCYLSPPRFSYLRQRHGNFPIPLHQHLFSQGILNPKAP